MKSCEIEGQTYKEKKRVRCACELKEADTVDGLVLGQGLNFIYVLELDKK